ncbi:MAG: hypothetical protein BMS9Abin25_0379 [Gammaproteobacteria bacterium]|nr:MAG: hypothetical protein BMS9Abin25_0379 [Gammaproteobacteria bacterium]
MAVACDIETGPVKLLKRILIIKLILLLISVIFLFGTTAGLRVMLLLADRLAGTEISLTAGNVEGRLYGNFVLHDLRVDTPRVEIILKQVELEWNPLGLLRGVFDIERLALENGTVNLVGSDSDYSPGKGGPRWFPDINLEELNIYSVQVSRDDRVYPVEQFTGQATLESKQLNLVHAELQMPHLTANASGVADLLALSVNGVQLAWNWQPPQLLQPIKGTATLNGDTDQLQFEAVLSSPTTVMLDMELDHPFKEPVWRAGFSMAKVNLREEVSAGLPDVVVSLEGNGKGNAESIKLDATGNMLFDEVSHLWQLDASVPMTGDSYPLLKVESGQASVTVTPDETRSDLAQIHVDIPDFGELWPGLAGQLQGKGELLGARRSPTVNMTVNGTDLVVGDYQMERIDATVQLDFNLSHDAPMLISARVEKALVAGREFDGEMQLEGALRDARLDLKLIEANRGSIELVMKGGLDNDRLSADIEHLSLDHPDLGQWQTSEVSTLKMTRNDGQLSRLCLNKADASLCTELTWQGGMQTPYFIGTSELQLPVASLGEPATVFSQTVLTMQIDGTDAAFNGESVLGGRPVTLSGQGSFISVDEWRFNMVAEADDVPVTAIPAISQQGDFTLTGLMRMNLDLAMDNTLKIDQLDAELLLKDGVLKRTFINGDQEELELRKSYLTATKQQDNLVIAGKLQGAYDGQLNVDFVLPIELDQLNNPDLPLNGRLMVNFPQLQVFGIFLDDAVIPEGTFSADIGVEGTRAAPQFLGQAVLEVPRLDLSVPNISFEETTLNIEFVDNKLLVGGGSQIDGRPIMLEGDAFLLAFDNWGATLRLAGESIKLEDVYGSSLQISPDLVVAITPGNVKLTGDVVLEGSDIYIRDISTKVRPSSDVRIVDEEQGATPNWHVVTDLGLQLTGENRLRVAGFDGLLGGSVRVRYETGKLASGEGVLTVEEGEYRAYGTSVPVRLGRLEFIGGALDDPAIYIESRRRVEPGEVGFDVTGTLQSPIVTLVSNPVMDDSEILSWLLYGQAEGASYALLAGSVNTMLGREEEESFIQRMLNRMGMTNMGVAADASGVGLSKQLTPRLFIKYQVNVWDQTESRLILRYILNDNWALEGVSGDEGSGDILFERER